MLPDDIPPQQRSLFRDLADGAAGIGVRIVVAFAAAIFYAGAAMAGSYLLAMAYPRLNRWGAGYYVDPRDEVIIVLALLAGAAWLATVAWLFLHGRRGMAGPAVKTLIIAVVAIAIGAAFGSSHHGDIELLMSGLVFLAAGAIILVWLQGIRAGRAGRPLRNPADQLLDIRCPDCGYRMVGLHESRCPECGRLYTLDQFLARQNFAPTTTAPMNAPPPPAQPLPNPHSIADRAKMVG